jgi:hypothetical protein
VGNFMVKIHKNGVAPFRFLTALPCILLPL